MMYLKNGVSNLNRIIHWFRYLRNLIGGNF